MRITGPRGPAATPRQQVLEPILRLKYNAQELHTRFDGDGGHERLAWYGEQRAIGLDHNAAVVSTYQQFRECCEKEWPERGIELPSRSHNSGSADGTSGNRRITLSSAVNGTD